MDITQDLISNMPREGGCKIYCVNVKDMVK